MAKDRIPATERHSSLTEAQKGAVGVSFVKETDLYEAFFQKITDHARTHRQITINNLNAVDERLAKLSQEAERLKYSIFFHDEEIVVERSKIIRNTESAVHDQNVSILEYDRMNSVNLLEAVDHLSRSLLSFKGDFFKSHQRDYLHSVIETEDYFEFYMQKSTEFQTILSRYEEEIAKIFQSLDAEIEGMDTMIAKIIHDKNAKVVGIERFYDREMKHYWDNQYTYSAEPDPTSIEIQAIASDKINQFNAFKNHSISRDADVRNAVEADYLAVYDRVFQHLLRRASYLLVEKYDFFDDPEKYLEEQKRLVVTLELGNNKRAVAPAVRKLERLEQWRKINDRCARKAGMMLRRQLTQKKMLLLSAETDTARKIGKMALSLDEYLAIIRIDPFLAQALGDQSSQVIKNERLDLSMLRVNKELKTNINYDIQSAKIKSQINALETKLSHAVNTQMIAEESELLQKIADINDFVIETRENERRLRIAIARERGSIARLERAVNVHLSYLIDSLNTDRMWLSIVFDELIKRTRQGETHEIYVVEAKSEIELLLKHYEMKALHFQTSYQNELAYLVQQKSRIGEENKINNEFILTTYMNQMRFAQEQLEFADSEFRLRLKALADTVEDERRYHREAIDNVKLRYEKEIRLAEDDYQARLYTEAQHLEQTTDPKRKKSVQGELDKQRKLRDNRVNTLVASLSDDQTIAKAMRELARLDDYFELAVKDAEKLREATIDEFTALYEFAKARYETLKPYLEAAVDVMDPVFYDMLASIEERRHYELKLAEAQLDERMEPLLNQYREVFFKQTEGYDKVQYLELVDAIMASRERSEAVYRTGLVAIEQEHQAAMAVFDADDAAVVAEAKTAHAELAVKTDFARAQLKTRGVTLESSYLQQVGTDSDKLQKTIAQLTDEYLQALRSHHQFTSEIAEDFAKFLKANGRYVKTAMHQVSYRRVTAPLKAENRHKTNRIVRDIHKKYRHYQITAPESK